MSVAGSVGFLSIALFEAKGQGDLVEGAYRPSSQLEFEYPTFHGLPVGEIQLSGFVR